MRTGVDTNVFSIIWLGGEHSAVAGRVLSRCSSEGSLAISPIVYAEMLANPMLGEGQAEVFLEKSGIVIDYTIDPRVWSEAGRRFGAYAKRKRVSGGGEARRLLADFVVGAHALVQAERLLTFDKRRYARDFPELRLVEILS
jgi:predicted nucleic acid-binding protein